MAKSTKKQLSIVNNNMLTIYNKATAKIELVVGLSDKIIRPMPDDEENTILISSDFHGREGFAIKFKEAFGKSGERFNDVDDVLKYLAPTTK